MAPCWEIVKGRAINGIPITQDGFIIVGEQGRGRSMARVPVPMSHAAVENDRLVGLYLKPDPDRGTPAVVLIRDHSGFRGGWRLTAARTDQEWETIVLRDRYHAPDGVVAPGHEVEILGRSCPACDEKFPVPPRKEPDVRILAQGRCAQGDAGRMGGGPEYLLLMYPGQALEIVRWGRLYGNPDVLRVTLDSDGMVLINDPRAEAESRLAAAELEKYVWASSDEELDL